MFCIGCGEKLPTNARYCPKCGEKIFDSPSVGDSSNIKFLHEQSQEIDTILNNLESPKEQDHLEQPNLNTVMNPVKQKLDITALGLVLLILICVFVIAKFSDSNSKPSTTTKPQVIVEENKPPKIDCSKVGNNPSFGEMDACNLKSSSSTTYKPKTSNSSSSKPVAKSVEDIIREGLGANCSNLPSNFMSLRFQYRGETFNNYGDPLDLYALGNANLTYLRQGSTARIGYSDDATYSVLNTWQCIFPFNTSR